MNNDSIREAVDGRQALPIPRYSGWLWTHIVKGGDYRMLGEAKLQTDKPLSDMAEVVVYQGADGRLWAREGHEFKARFSRTRPDVAGAHPVEVQPTASDAIRAELAAMAPAGGGGLHRGWMDIRHDGIRSGLERALELVRAATPTPLPAAPAVQGWMPIESAPKDGRTILLGKFNANGKWRTMRGQWYSKATIEEEWESDDCPEGWYETTVECPEDVNCWFIDSPTDWQPLPAAPATPTGEAK